MTVKELIDKYLGILYKHRGRTLQGLDCWGFCKLVYKDLGFDLWDIEEEYTEDWAWKGKNYFIENYYKEWERVKRPGLFDGILFCNSRGVSNHAGIYIGDGKFMHCCKQGVVQSRLDDVLKKRRLQGYYHLKARDDHN